MYIKIMLKENKEQNPPFTDFPFRLYSRMLQRIVQKMLFLPFATALLLLLFCFLFAGTESVVMRMGCGRGVRGLWRYGTVVVGVWGVADVGGDRDKWVPNARGIGLLGFGYMGSGILGSGCKWGLNFELADVLVGLNGYWAV
ncbi:hypothetical protein ES332_A08G096800v1 [Gossypium tomentosum]|uniref:Uncharacterized protein n=1 Tax=Gossypium tomentosum TaxID=34277 RepID=A0A5D2PCR6_GOSTO|nr:hypothetical protein ES332_A08G096800v1 [Gossypium tomentosum]